MSEKTAPTPANGPNPENSGPIGEISQEPSAFEAFLDANQKKLVIVGILAILGLVAYVIYDGIKKMNDKEDSAVVAAARTVPEFEAAAEKVGSKNAAGSALIFKSQLQWRDQQKQDAIATLERVISEYPEHPALASAKAALGSYQQQVGDLEKAKTTLQEAADLKGAASSLALLSLGDLASQEGKDEEAKKIYNSIISDYGSSHPQVKTMAEQRLKLVGVAAPAIAPPKETPTGPTPGTPALPGVPSNPIVVPPTAPIQVTPTPTPVPAPSESSETEPSEKTSEPAETTSPAESDDPEEGSDGN